MNCVSCASAILQDEPVGRCRNCQRILCEGCIADYCEACNIGAVSGKRCGASILPNVGDRYQCDRQAVTINGDVPLCEVCAGRVTLPLHCAECAVHIGSRSLFGIITCGPEFCHACKWRHQFNAKVWTEEATLTVG